MKYTILLYLLTLSGICNSENKIGKQSAVDNLSVSPIAGASVGVPSTWHGVNLPLFIGVNSARELSLADFTYAANAGANVIRLAVFADQDRKTYVKFLDSDGSVSSMKNSSGIAALDKAIAMAGAAQVKVIIDMHTMPGDKDAKIWQDQQYWNDLMQIWCLIAERFKDNKTVLAFDLMNEPGIVGYIRRQNVLQKAGAEAMMFSGRWTPPDDWKNTPRDYSMQMAKIITAIRKIDNSRCVIVEGFGVLGNPVNFSWMKPITGFKNIVYSFHMYVPTGLTMLGTKGSIKKGKDAKVQPFDPKTDGALIDKALAPVIAFQKKYNVPIYVGEFGITNNAVFGKNADGKSYNGACWLSTVIGKMDENKWGWTYWDFWNSAARKPNSVTDPRYIILSAAMKHKPIPEYCK